MDAEADRDVLAVTPRYGHGHGFLIYSSVLRMGTRDTDTDTETDMETKWTPKQLHICLSPGSRTDPRTPIQSSNATMNLNCLYFSSQIPVLT